MTDEAGYLLVKNFEKYQDTQLAKKYRESGGILPWLKQVTERLQDIEYSRLHPLSRYIHSEIINLTAKYGEGKIPNDPQWLEAKMHLYYVRDQVVACVDELIDHGFLQVITESGAESGARSGASKSSELREVLDVSPNGDTPPQVSAKTEQQRENIRLVYDHWRTARSKTDARYAKRIAPRRESAIRARLRDGYTVAELCRAIDNVALDNWADRSRHDDIPTLLGSQEKVDKWLDLGDSTAVLSREEREQRHLASLREKEPV